LKEIIICVDNDETGLTHAREAAEIYNQIHRISVKIMYPKEGYKVFNDELKAMRFHGG
jgi:hypothetical protein